MDRSMLSRATEGTEAPTPGYLYLDIAKNAASSPIACSEIAQYLTSRLNNKNNANIKYKCLKVISKTAVSPVTRGQFKRTLAQDSNAMAAIKEALQFRGPPDPARGDEPYQKVRTAAKEALDAIYSDAPTSMEHQPPQMQGIGSAGGYARTTGFQTNSNQIHQPPPTSGTGRRMEGIGNPMYQNHRMSSTPTTSNTGFDIGTMTIGEIAKEATATFTNMIKDPLARNVELPPKYENSSVSLWIVFTPTYPTPIPFLTHRNPQVRSSTRQTRTSAIHRWSMDHGFQSWSQLHWWKWIHWGT